MANTTKKENEPTIVRYTLGGEIKKMVIEEQKRYFEKNGLYLSYPRAISRLIEKNVRKYSTPDFLDCIDRLAKGLPIHDEDSNTQYIVLSPGDLVFVPEAGENFSQIDWGNKKKVAEKIYIMKSSSVSTCYFLPMSVSALIEKGEFESLSKSEKTKDKANPQIIKENFIKLKIDRLGNISPVII